MNTTQAEQTLPSAAADANRLRLWFEGEQATPGSIDVFVERGADPRHLSEIAPLADSVAFLFESDMVTLDETWRVVQYSGRLEPYGGEISLPMMFFYKLRVMRLRPMSQSRFQPSSL